MSYMKVTIDREKNIISIRNDGLGIPIEIHKEYDIYIPELIFGHLLTSSNYDDTDKKVTGGRNGFGAKLTNIFSKVFTVETCDGKKSFKQVFKNNMSHKGVPEIKEAAKNKTYTCITFEPDLVKFKMENLDDDIISLMIKRVYDMAGVTPAKVKVYLNEELIDVKNFSSYIDMFLTTQENENPLPIVKEKPNERWDIGVSLSEGQFQQVSYVNAISTSKGGTHINYVLDKIIDHIMDQIPKKDKKLNIKAHNVKAHLWIFVNCLIENASFDSQTKENMTLKASSFGSTFEFSPGFLKDVIKTGIVDHVLSFAKTRDELKMTKTLNAGSKKVGRLCVPKLEDANNAGTRNSHLCTLILTEGDSAKTIAMAGIEIVGRDNYGCFPLRGKMLNVRDANAQQVQKNEEIQNLVKILGLNLGKKYEDVKQLRYGSIMIMTDQDHDGSHIKGLIINFIHHFWPSLIQINGFMKEFITPILKATKNKEVHAFYTIPEYKDWVESIGGSPKGWVVKYYKGLGTSNDKEAKEYFSDIARHKIEFTYQDQVDDTSIDLAFSKKRAEDRKNWLAAFDEENSFKDSRYTHLKYEDFINKEFILFSIADNARSIPSLCDGLKPSERKILFCCFKRKLKEEIKIAQLAGYVSEHSAYHHGEASLNSTIIALAQSFVGSNNINLLLPNGQFGTRNLGGKDAASARYIFTALNKVTRHLFNINDDPLMDYIMEENQKIEPNFYLPIIPLILVNGSEGIGTGWSSNIPCFNPREIIENIKCRIKTGAFNSMKPWYKGFDGSIEPSDKEGTYLVSGKWAWKPDDHGVIVITELPIKKWTREYKTFLEVLMGIEPSNMDAKEKLKRKKKEEDEEEKAKEKKVKVILEDFKEYHTNNKVHFEIRLLPEFIDEFMADDDKVVKTFKLQTTMSVNNMVLFDAQNRIRKYANVEEIMEEFYQIRVEYYKKRKLFLQAAMRRDLCVLDNKARFIAAVVEEKIQIRKVKKKDLVNTLFKEGFQPMSEINKILMKNNADMEKKIEAIEVPEEDGEGDENPQEDETGMKVPSREYDYLLGMPIWSLTYEKVEDLMKQKKVKIGELEVLDATDETTIWSNDIAEFLITIQQVEDAEEQDRKGEIAKKHKTMGAKAANGKKGVKETGKDKEKAEPKKNKKPAAVDEVKKPAAVNEGVKKQTSINSFVEVITPKTDAVGKDPKVVKNVFKEAAAPKEILTLQERVAARCKIFLF